MSTKLISTITYINLFLIIALFIFLLIVLFEARRNNIVVNNISWKVQQGLSSSSDMMITGGNNLYVSNATSNLTLTIQSNINNKIGRQIAIKNNTKNTITLVGDNGVVLNPPSSLTINPGEYTLWIIDKTPNNFLLMNL